MKNTKFILFLFCLTTTLTLNAVELTDKGYRNTIESIIKDYTLLNITPSARQLADHIKDINYMVTRKEAKEIAQNILNVSYCFEIDPWILMSLIQKESSFDRYAMSPTNAAGLTQFTSVGFIEVHDQLGYRGRKGAPESATLYFTSKIRKCIDSNWVDLWSRVNILDTEPGYYDLLKEELKSDITAAITYGAILLKTYLAYIDAKDGSEELSTSEIYYAALIIYNGEEGEAKIQYAKSVFRNLQRAYPKPLEFPFL